MVGEEGNRTRRRKEVLRMMAEQIVGSGIMLQFTSQG